jgi:integrase
LKQFLNYAVDCGYILKNPCSGKKISIPKEASNKTLKKNIPIFTDEELCKIITLKTVKLNISLYFSSQQE